MKNNKIKKVIAVTILSHFGLAAFSQGFINLDFESANIIPVLGSPIYPYEIAISDALPGWAVNGTTQGDMTYNDPSLGATSVNLWASNGSQISGNYSVLLTGGLSPFPATISQTGLVPAGSESLTFEAQAGSSSLVVSLGGQDLSYFAIGSGPNYTLYGADVSAFAGQSEQLIFSALNVSSGLNNWNLDNIQFSALPVPEPSSFGLFALGGLFVALLHWKYSSPKVSPGEQ
jgi:hypothetical protein